MVKLFIAVVIAVLSYADAQATASAFATAGQTVTMTSTSGPSAPKYYKKAVVEEPKPSPKPVILKKKAEDKPSPKPIIKIVDGKKDKEMKVEKKEDKKEGIKLLIESAPAPASDAAPVATDGTCTTIVEAAAATPELSTLAAAVEAAGLTEALSDPNLIATVLAPTNAAFEALFVAFDATPERVLADPQLANILLYHVIGGAAVKAADLEEGAELTTLVGQSITVDLSDGAAFVGFGSTGKVIAADVETCKAVVHVIDTVLLPDFRAIE